MTNPRSKVSTRKAASKMSPIDYAKVEAAAADADAEVKRARAVDMTRLGLSDFYRKLIEDVFYALLANADSPGDMEHELSTAVLAVADAEFLGDPQKQASTRQEDDARSGGIAWTLADVLIRRRSPL